MAGSMQDVEKGVDDAVDGPPQDGDSQGPDPQDLAQQVADLIKSGMDPQQFMQMVQQAMQSDGGDGPPQQSEDDDNGKE